MEVLSRISPVQLAIGFGLALVIALAALFTRNLSRSGAVGALVLGTIVFGLGGVPWAVLLIVFFVTSTLLSILFKKHKAKLVVKYSKGSERDLGQVTANGLFAGIFTILHLFFPDAIWPWLGFAGSLAAVNSDTWATELGVLSPVLPRMVTTGETVEYGTSGGITPVGMFAAISGAFAIAFSALLVWPESMTRPTGVWGLLVILLITLAGVLGGLMDSFLGATVQAMYFCPSCEKETEKHPLHSCGTQTRLTRGQSWFGNDLVNGACSLTGALMGVIFALLG